MGRIIDPVILREYDIRGIVGESLTPEVMRLIGQGYGTILRERGMKTIAVGRDGRLSSPDLEQAVVDGLVAAGMTVRRIGLGPTPMLYFATHHLRVDAGAMVTGSHNPSDYNGLKMVAGGKSFYGADIQELGRRIEAGELTVGEGEEAGTSVFDAYVERIAADYRGSRDLKIAWDPGNGAAGDVVSKLAEVLPGYHVLINAEIDGTFPRHHPDPTVEKNLEQLKAAVEAHGCDVGVAFDGDGDRIGLIDGTGHVLWGDQMLILLAREVLADEPGATVIADVKASKAFFEEVTRMGGKALMSKTGHSLIKTMMQETGAPLAGEMSAHLFIKHRYYGYDDAAYAAIRLLSILASGEQSLAEMREALPHYVNTPELRFPCAEDRKAPVIEEVKARLAATDARVHDIDGVRVETDDGWWLLRASNTQDVLVARCEADDDAGLGRLKAALRDQLAASGISLTETH
ncbi:MAG: phosphomannomutase/phosphoglucomutase [Rhodospirillales bacterium]